MLHINCSPSVALNRLSALYKVKGWEIALTEAERLKMDNNHFYFILLGELYKHTDAVKAQESLSRAYSLAKTATEKKAISKKMGEI